MSEGNHLFHKVSWIDPSNLLNTLKEGHTLITKDTLYRVTTETSCLKCNLLREGPSLCEVCNEKLIPINTRTTWLGSRLTKIKLDPVDQVMYVKNKRLDVSQDTGWIRLDDPEEIGINDKRWYTQNEGGDNIDG